MGPYYRILLSLLILIFLVTISSAQDDDADELPAEGNIVLVDSAFVRSGPSDDYVAVGALYEGDTVFPLNISENGLWVLIPYSRSQGWIQRNLVRWEDEAALNLLPVLAANITPTPRIPVTNTPFIPTITPEGSYVNVTGAASAYVRAGPGRGYLRLGQLLPGENVEAVARNDDTSWIMIRYSDGEFFDGFGWVALELVYWEDLEALEELPIVLMDDLTPTMTFTPSPTPSITPTASSTATATLTATATPTLSETPTATSSATATDTSMPSDTPTLTQTPEPSVTATTMPSVTPSETSTATLTVTATPTVTQTASPVPSNTAMDTATPQPTVTEFPSETASATSTLTSTVTVTVTPNPTETWTATSTNTASPTNTTIPSATATVSSTNTVSPSATNTEVVEVVIAISETSDFTPTQTASPTELASETASATESVTDIFALQSTSLALEATNDASQISESDIIEEDANPEIANRLPIEAIVGVIVLLLVLIYIWFYWQGLAAVGRYANGFVVNQCPVCERGHLHLDEKQVRTLGIPTARRTVRCDVCRSVLRQTGNKTWRYAVDRIENPTMYDRFNGREVSDTDIERLAKSPPSGAKARTSPEFVDNEPDE